MAALRLQLEAADNAYRKQAAEKMEDLLETQRQLSERKQQLASLVNTLKQEREGTEGIVAEMGAKTQQLRLWLDANEAKVDAVAGMGKEIDIAKAIVPVDALNEQALNAQAEDLAIEDTILALDRALQTGLTGLTVETYLKQVRQLCRRQFFARTAGFKISEVQAAKPANVMRPGHTLPYAVRHGDGWTHTTVQPPPPPM
uniref:SB domain-containing protein n=1 Tax=Chlamydomonas euryale TaxID=1486919 RepID=A0A7R9VVF6_9CHLO|mmetsp:Transcript_5373/g.16264  ORF Transcript_5373/g.16264 Transcript_5373/m.16264 type:complete len:200 (+) Transcript_5373:524-1123(+)